MPTLVLRENISPAANKSVFSSLRKTLTRADPSLEGVLIFSGIGLMLMALGILFQILELPPPYF